MHGTTFFALKRCITVRVGAAMPACEIAIMCSSFSQHMLHSQGKKILRVFHLPSHFLTGIIQFAVSFKVNRLPGYIMQY